MMSPTVKGYAKEDLNHFPLAEYEAHYTVNWLGIYSGESVHKLSRLPNGLYHFEATTQPNIRILPYHSVESSNFSWQQGEILPRNYSYNIQEGTRHKKGNVNFDWQSLKVRNPKTPEHWESEIAQGTQDKLTQTLCLRQALLKGHTTLNFMVAEYDKLKSYHFVILGEERLSTKLGTFDTVKVEHISRKGHRTTMWFAKKLDYLPVKMAQSRRGKQVAGGEILSFNLKS